MIINCAMVNLGLFVNLKNNVTDKLHHTHHSLTVSYELVIKNLIIYLKYEMYVFFSDKV